MILIGTHHKTGTVWMLRVFQGIASHLNWRFCKLPSEPMPEADIYFMPHSSIPSLLLERDFRGLHLIRDPRDVLISGMHYHKWSKEAWLHVPKDDFDGLTYQQKLNSLKLEEQLRFEMHHAGKWTVRQMHKWDYTDPRFFEARYEELISESGPSLFREALIFLGISEGSCDKCLEFFHMNSLAASNFSSSGDPHIRSGRARQWCGEMRKADGEEFLATFGDCLIQLGYEKNNDWVQGLPA